MKFFPRLVLVLTLTGLAASAETATKPLYQYTEAEVGA